MDIFLEHTANNAVDKIVSSAESLSNGQSVVSLEEVKHSILVHDRLLRLTPSEGTFVQISEVLSLSKMSINIAIFTNILFNYFFFEDQSNFVDYFLDYSVPWEAYNSLGTIWFVFLVNFCQFNQTKSSQQILDLYQVCQRIGADKSTLQQKLPCIKQLSKMIKLHDCELNADIAEYTQIVLTKRAINCLALLPTYEKTTKGKEQNKSRRRSVLLMASSIASLVIPTTIIGNAAHFTYRIIHHLVNTHLMVELCKKNRTRFFVLQQHDSLTSTD